MSETVTISTLDHEGSFDCYCARPAGEASAAIVVIQEIFGVNAGIRQKCDKLAEAGYLALAPDLFWRVQPGIELDPDVKASATSKRQSDTPATSWAAPRSAPSAIAWAAGSRS